jgi:hypothetical protein
MLSTINRQWVGQDLDPYGGHGKADLNSWFVPRAERTPVALVNSETRREGDSIEGYAPSGYRSESRTGFFFSENSCQSEHGVPAIPPARSATSCALLVDQRTALRHPHRLRIMKYHPLHFQTDRKRSMRIVETRPFLCLHLLTLLLSASAANAETIELKSGDKLENVVVIERSEDRLVLEHPVLGRLEIPAIEVKE